MVIVDLRFINKVMDTSDSVNKFESRAVVLGRQLSPEGRTRMYSGHCRKILLLAADNVIIAEMEVCKVLYNHHSQLSW
ncbi:MULTISPECIES: hypothetical protein [unclassified Mesorhizobium]|uniref:hypothetical protein n=1 Tax=unclassified Mesorhizobium TaxID=325217 RepID=UPI00333B2251